MRERIANFGHWIADFDTQTGLTGKVMEFCWWIGYPEARGK